MQVSLEVDELASDARSFKTIADALQAVRTLRRVDRDSDITISVASGYYELPSAISLTAAEAPGPGWLNLNGDGSPTPILSAGRRLRCSRAGLTTSCDLPKDPPDSLLPSPRGNPIAGFFLAAGGRLMHPAAWPSSSGETRSLINWALFSRVDDRTLRVVGDIGGLGGLEGEAVQFHLWPSTDWYDQYISANRTSDPAIFHLSRLPNYPLAEVGRLAIEGNPGLLRAAGDWVVREGKVVGIPYSSNEAPLVATHLSSVIVLKDARNVRLQNLRLQHAQHALIDIVGGKSIEVTRNKFGPSGGQAVQTRDATDLVFRANEASELGGGGFYVSGGDRSHLHSARIVIEGNSIMRFSLALRTYQPAIRLDGVGIRVESNDICESDHSGIILQGNDHVIRGNHLCRLCLESSDCGAIYAGRDITYLGNSIVGNIIEEVFGRSLDTRHGRLTSPANAVGIYLDDGVGGFQVIGNTLRRIGDIGILIAGGSRNELLGNYIEHTPRPIIIDSRWGDFPWERNAAASIKSAHPDWIDWYARYPAFAPDHVSTEPENNVVAWNEIGGADLEGARPIISLDASESNNTFCENHILPGASQPRVLLHCARRQKPVTNLDWAQWPGAQTCALRVPDSCHAR